MTRVDPHMNGLSNRLTAVGCVLALTVVVGSSGAPAAQARSCGDASVSGYHRIEVFNGVTCRGAKRRIRRWSRVGFPHNEVGWFCQTKPRRKLCSFGNGNAPYFTFLRR